MKYSFKFYKIVITSILLFSHYSSRHTFFSEIKLNLVGTIPIVVIYFVRMLFSIIHASLIYYIYTLKISYIFRFILRAFRVTFHKCAKICNHTYHILKFDKIPINTRISILRVLLSQSAKFI